MMWNNQIYMTIYGSTTLLSFKKAAKENLNIIEYPDKEYV